MSFDVLAISPNPLLNLVHAGDYTPGAVNRVGPMSMLAEGKGANVARTLSRFGHRVVLAGFAGGHSGSWLADLVRAEGVHEVFTRTASPLRVGFMASGRESDHPTTVFPNGFTVTAEECHSLLATVAAHLDQVRLVIAAGTVPDPIANDLYRDLLALCAQHRVPCWMDAHGACMTQALNGPVVPALAKPNRQEWAKSTGWERVDELHISDGANPVEVIHRREGRFRVIPPLIRQINPIGSGDCYVCGLAHGWLTGQPWQERLRLAAAAGAANALRQDVAMIPLDEVLALVEQVRVEKA